MSTPVTASERILIVDDNRFNAKLAEHLLKGEGFEVRSVEDGAAMWAMLPTWPVRLILMDIGLPGTDGLALTRTLRLDPANRGMVIVAFSAEATDEETQRARDAGCDGYIAKPIDVGSFGGVVRGLLNTGHR
jgi:CheY-like chemotaxis protein